MNDRRKNKAVIHACMTALNNCALRKGIKNRSLRPSSFKVYSGKGSQWQRQKSKKGTKQSCVPMVYRKRLPKREVVTRVKSQREVK